MITLGLCEIRVGDAILEATSLKTSVKSLTKIGKTYKDTCKLAHDKSESVEHFEEGHAAPEVCKKAKKLPVLTFSIMDPDPTFLGNYVGGETVEVDGWGMDGTEVVKNKCIHVISEQGLDIVIPNADIEATLNVEFSSKGIGLVDFEVKPCAVTSGKPFNAFKHDSLNG